MGVGRLAVPIIYGMFRATVKTAQTHGAVLLHPNRLFVLHFNSLNRAFLSAKCATNAGVGHGKILCLSHFAVINPFLLKGYPQSKRLPPLSSRRFPHKSCRALFHTEASTFPRTHKQYRATPKHRWDLKFQTFHPLPYTHNFPPCRLTQWISLLPAAL